MNVAFFAVGCLAIALGIVHSILGELLVLRRLMAWDGRAADGAKVLSLGRRRTLRASWHLVTVLGFGFAAMLLLAAFRGGFGDAKAAVAATFLASAGFWLLATRGRHPAWVVLGLIGVLVAVS